MFGDPTVWVPQHMARVRALGEVRFIPRTPAAQVVGNIRKALADGPFDVFCVRLPSM